MCCQTHYERDARDRENGVAIDLASGEEFRCRCTFGNSCKRRATQEDILCDWCRGRDHYNACQELSAEDGMSVADYRAMLAKKLSPGTIQQMGLGEPPWQT